MTARSKRDRPEVQECLAPGHPALEPFVAYATSVVSTLDFSPSPPAEGGEGREEEDFSACRRVGLSAVGCPSPRPSPRSFLTGRGNAVRAPNRSSATKG